MNATMTSENLKHYPVMLKQVISIISPQHGGMFIDCTFGCGGYSKAILNFPNTEVVGIDRDVIAKDHADNLIKKFPNRFKFHRDKFSNLNKIVRSNYLPRVIIFDLGLSASQIADRKRGFSFKSKGPLNMEMGINTRSTFEVVNKLSKEELARVIKVLGEEKDARKIASGIIKQRSKKPIERSEELVSIIKNVKKNYRKFKKDPATKTFQALRIFVNNELTELIKGLFEATKLLPEGGILLVVNFHSIEDRIVKNFFKLYSNINNNPSRYVPKKNEENLNLFKAISKKVLIPDKKEIVENIASRSAKLRYGIRSNNSFFLSEAFKKKFENYLKMDEAEYES